MPHGNRTKWKLMWDWAIASLLLATFIGVWLKGAEMVRWINGWRAVGPEYALVQLGKVSGGASVAVEESITLVRAERYAGEGTQECYLFEVRPEALGVLRQAVNQLPTGDAMSRWEFHERTGTGDTFAPSSPVPYWWKPREVPDPEVVYHVMIYERREEPVGGRFFVFSASTGRMYVLLWGF
jgi:hypothetical protein